MHFSAPLCATRTDRPAHATVRHTVAMSRSLLSTLTAVMAATNYSGPSQLNRDLHSLPDCTYTDSVCKRLPWTDDAAYMVSDDGAEKWGERLLYAAMFPFLIITLWILVDTTVRCVRFCCCKRKKGAPRSRRGCLTRCCCWGCDDAFDADAPTATDTEQFISPRHK